MENKTNQKEANVILTAQAEPENKTMVKGDYTRYFYRSIEQHNLDIDELATQNGRLWDAVVELQNDLNRLRAKLKEA
jgi:dynactin complex subunit